MVKLINNRKRMQICHACPHLNKGIIKPSTCNICGCAIRAKTKIENEKCPIDKW